MFSLFKLPNDECIAIFGTSLLKSSRLLYSQIPARTFHCKATGIAEEGVHIVLDWRNNARREFVSLLSVNSLEKMEIKGIE